MHTKIIQFIFGRTTALQRVPIRARARGYAHTWGAPLLIVIVLAVVVVGLSGTALAAVQGYKSQDGVILKGMAVSLSTEQPVTTANDTLLGVVQKSSMTTADRTMGVVVDLQSGAVSVTEQGAQVYVANSGVAMVFTTNLNGDIHEGDLLAPSPIKGVLMRATEGSKGVLGVAMEDFPTENTETVTVKDGNKDIEAKVAPVTMNMDVKFVTNTSGNAKTILQRLGEAVVGREVSTAQVVISMVILGMLILVEGGIVYAAVSSTIISLGRNPFARKTILRALFQITILVVVVMVLGLAAVYVVLWL